MMSTDFSVALDQRNPRCMAHPDQPLLHTPQFGGRALMTCPVCNAEWVAKVASHPETITVKVTAGIMERAVEIGGGLRARVPWPEPPKA